MFYKSPPHDTCCFVYSSVGKEPQLNKNLKFKEHSLKNKMYNSSITRSRF